MKMCSHLRIVGDVGAIVDIDEKRRWSLAKGLDHTCHPIRALAPELLTLVIAGVKGSDVVILESLRQSDSRHQLSETERIGPM